MQHEQLLRLPEVSKCVGLSKSGIYKGVREGWFPAPILLGSKRAVAWPESFVQSWIAARIADAGNGGTVGGDAP